LTSLTGLVLDARTGTALDRVRVLVEDAGVSGLTADDGSFHLAGLTPGLHRLNVSVVGYALFRTDVNVTIGMAPTIIRLSEGTTAYSEAVTVTGDTFRSPPDPVPSASILGNAELLNLRGVLADDPLRAVQVLPGVATGDDLRSEFTVRGSDFHHITFTMDGFASPYLLHTVRGVEDRGPTGSVAMLNSDVLDDVTLLNGGYPQHFGGRTGAEVDFRTREGSRQRNIFRIAVSGTSASAVAEGPIGSSGRGSWLVSGRQSYIDHLVRHLTEHSVSFGFADAQGRLAYDVTPSQHLDVTLLTGHSQFLNEPGEHDIDDVYDATNAAVVGVASWRLTRPAWIVTQRLLAAENHFRNENQQDVELDNGKDRQLAYRADATVRAARSFQIDAGAEVERRDDSRIRRRLAANRVSLAQLDDYSANAVASGAYASLKWTPAPRLTIRARRARRSLDAHRPDDRLAVGADGMARGGRLRRSGEPPADTSSSPTSIRCSARPPVWAWCLNAPRSTTSEPSAACRGRCARASLVRPRRAGHAPSVRQRNARRRRARRSPAGQLEVREPPGGFRPRRRALAAAHAPWRRVLGMVVVRLRRHRYHDVISRETYWGDNDQRHTVNAYAMYRHSDRLSFVGKLRYGSNFPIPGYYSKQTFGGGDIYLLSDHGNAERLPFYARLDLRANRAFTWSQRRITLFAEVINVLNRANVRFDPPLISIATRSVSQPFDSMLPIIPSVAS
jgi:hypothetical protein